MASQDSVKQVVIVGGGSAGISVATSLLKRKSDLDITIIDPAGDHYYQPGFTLVGGGVFTVASAVDGVNFFTSADDINSAVFTLYGLAK